MSAEIAIAELLIADGTVSTRAPGGVHMLKLPQTPTLPAVRIQLITEQAGYVHEGETGLYRSTIQVDAYAAEATGGDPYAAALALGEAIRAVLSGRKNYTGGGSPPAARISGILRSDRQVRFDAEELEIVTCLQEFHVFWQRL